MGSLKTTFLAISMVFLALAGGCFDTPTPDCAFTCGEQDNLCPTDYSCRDDGLCKLIELPDDHQCETLSPPTE